MEKEQVILQESLENTFGCNVFNDASMRSRLPKNVYKALKKTIDEGLPLDPTIADVVANAMKDWAIERGATHFTHWFQPMTGITAEKHDSFISPTNDGRIIMEFSGKELIKGEPDASSFPSGGLRATFEARGYTAWDCTSPAFLKDSTLCIPTAFCSYTGEALDQKTPLLRSMEALSKQAVRVLRCLGNTAVTRVLTTVGPEQEYFVIDKKLYDLRKDLILTGRTLFGSKSPKGQELEDHYFGGLKERIANFMREVDMELWKLGVLAKTKHNEVAPAQHELAPIFSTTNVATDHNQLTMETLKKVANRQGLVCLLHEKPFAGVNGSGKHNNWSMSTNDGQNLLEPGKTPHDNEQFLLFLAAVVQAVDEYSDLLRASAANTGNDHRLGANEAPPAIISIFLGEQLTDIFEQLETGSAKSSKGGGDLAVGVSTLPTLPKDTTDRNRTSPFAFTGNKFEFRMVASSASIAAPNTVLNTIVAETLSKIADRLEKTKDVDGEVQKIVQEVVKNNKRIIFNGNNYANEWVTEAEKRGLPNIKSTVAAIPAWITDKAVKMFEKHAVLSKVEVHSRYEIYLESYVKQINIEALTMLDIAKRQIVPAVIKYTSKIADSIAKVKTASVKANTAAQETLLVELTNIFNSFTQNVAALEKTLEHNDDSGDTLKHAQYYHDKVFTAMANLRADGDKLETLVDAKIWPLPTYADLLFNV
jgi:glutamine synthetase